MELVCSQSSLSCRIYKHQFLDFQCESLEGCHFLERGLQKIWKSSLLSNHPCADGLWQLNVAEQMILDEGAANPEKYKDNKFTETTDFDEENNVEYTKAYFKKALLQKTILKTNVNELDLDAARDERQLNNKLKKEAEAREREFKVENLRRSIEMDEYDLMHWHRSLEEKEALIRDISWNLEDLMLTLHSARAAATQQIFCIATTTGESPRTQRRADRRVTEDHKEAVVGKGNVWYEMFYEEAIKQKERREAKMKNMPKEK